MLMALSLLIAKISKKGVRNYCCCIHLNDPYIISAVRTPIGVFQGKLASLTAVQLGSQALSAAVEKANIPKEEIQELVLGCANSAGLGQGPARQIAIFSGLPTSIITSSVNKLCASGMKALSIGCQLILSNAQEVVAIAGAESLTNVPYILRRKTMRVGNICVPDTILHDNTFDIFEQVDVTEFAEQTVREYNFTREDQDNYAIQSYCKAAKASEEGQFAAEMVPLLLKKKDGEEVMCEDEEIKRFDAEKFRDLPPDIGRGGTITVGNSSGLHDGAAAMILASGSYVLKRNLQPLARIVSYCDSAVDSRKFCISPSVAVPRALVRANLSPEQISLWEISETFAVTALVNTKLLRLDPSRVNIHGGAISLGHPFGMTGVRLAVHLAHILKSGEYGCASISHATGGGSAVVIQKF